jgi:hypothetical protein
MGSSMSRFQLTLRRQAFVRVDHRIVCNPCNGGEKIGYLAVLIEYYAADAVIAALSCCACEKKSLE